MAAGQARARRRAAMRRRRRAAAGSSAATSAAASAVGSSHAITPLRPSVRGGACVCVRVHARRAAKSAPAEGEK